MKNENALIAEYSAVKQRLKILKVVGPLVLVAIIVVELYSVFSIFETAVDNSDKTAEHLVVEAEPVLEKIQNQLVKLGSDMKDPIAHQLQTYAEENAEFIRQQVDAQVTHLTRASEKELEEASKTIDARFKEKQQEIIANAFKGTVYENRFQNDKDAQIRLLTAAQDGSRQWAANRLKTDFNGHVSAMESIASTLNSNFRLKEGKQADPQDAMYAWLEMFADQVGDDSNIIGDKKVDTDKEPAAPKVAPAPAADAVPTTDAPATTTDNSVQ